MRRLEADGNVFLLLQVAFTELALTTFSSFIGVFFSSLLIGGAVGACLSLIHI